MRCEIISIGSELLTRKLSRTSLVVAGSLSGIGVRINRITTVPDDHMELVQALNSAISRSDVVITIGGLGATPDDITRPAVSEATGSDLVFSRKAMENVARYFAMKGMDVPAGCDRQADLLDGARMFANDKGSSPGQLVKINDTRYIVMLPGPVNEAESILAKLIKDFFKEKFERQIKKTCKLHVAGLCEVEAYAKIQGIIDTERQLEEGDIDFYFEPRAAGVDIVLEVWWDNELLVDEIMHKTRNEIYEHMGEYIYGEDGTTIESVIGQLLIRKRKTLSVAESCTGGLLASKITDAPGSSVYFKQGVVTYSSGSKIKTLGVLKETIDEHGAVSGEVAQQMSLGIKDIAKSDYAISVTGFAGPGSVREGVPGTGYIGIASPEGVTAHPVNFSGSRKLVKEMFSDTALRILWERLRDN